MLTSLSKELIHNVYMWYLTDLILILEGESMPAMLKHCSNLVTVCRLCKVLFYPSNFVSCCLFPLVTGSLSCCKSLSQPVILEWDTLPISPLWQKQTAVKHFANPFPCWWWYFEEKWNFNMIVRAFIVPESFPIKSCKQGFFSLNIRQRRQSWAPTWGTICLSTSETSWACFPCSTWARRST